MSYRPYQLSQEAQAIGLSVNMPSYNNFPQQSSNKLTSFSNSNQKKADLKNKIKEILNLCKDQNVAATRDIAGVAEEEKNIYNLLQQANFAADGTASQANPLFPPTPTNAPQNAGNYTPIRGQGEGLTNPGKTLQQDIRSMLSNNSNIQLSEEALQLINEIERRCLTQIEKMRDEKLALIAQLNSEIGQHNAQKKRNVELEREVEYLRQVANGGSVGPVAGSVGGGNEQELRNKIAYLENALNNVQQEGVRALMEHPDFRILFDQGEAIRKETIRLLRLKEAKGHTEDAEKRQMREVIESLQRKIEYLEQERGARNIKQSYEVINAEYSPIAKAHQRKDSYRNSANEYESLVMQMRKITNN